MGKKGEKKKKERMPDLLFPILAVICILPVTVRMTVYNCGYSAYDWYSGNDTITDFYCCAKSSLFFIIGAFGFLILLCFLAFYRECAKDMKGYLPLAFYSFFVVLSTIFSVNIRASWQGNFESFENCLVLIFYAVISLYAYQMMQKERDYKIVWYGILAITAVMAVVGTFQVFQHDLMNFPLVQKLLMSAENYEIYGGEVEDVFTGNHVYLTLYNPNYAGVFLNMVFAVVFVMFLTETIKNRKIIYGIFSAALVVLIWYTYSRMSLVTLVLSVVLGILFCRKKGGREIFVLFGFAVIALALLAVDIVGGGRFIGRIKDKKDREPLEELTTDETGISIIYGGEDSPVEYRLFFQGENLYCRFKEQEISAGEGEILNLPMGKDSRAFYKRDGGVIYVSLAETTLSFVKEKGEYKYRNFSGKTYPLKQVEKADFHGLEYLGSARGYIWSRTVPLLKKYLILGSGPDTYAEVFPQEDVAGKIVYADNPDRVMEKGHNDFLTKWVQTGGCSVVCLVIFYGYLIKKGWKVYRKRRNCRRTENCVGENLSFCCRMGYGCFLGCISFMVSSFTNDSTLQSAPLFWVLSGIFLAAADKN